MSYIQRLQVFAVVSTLAFWNFSTPTLVVGADYFAPLRGETPDGNRLQFLGTGSCSSTACHNSGNMKGRVSADLFYPQSSAEYTYWATHDPHGKAYAVLFNEKSRRIEANLGRLAQFGGAHNDGLCLSCHVHQGYSSSEHAPGFSLSDGIGCESCHGAAELYLVPHVSTGWRTLSDEQKSNFGLVPANKLSDRARMCTPCHVGSSVPDPVHGLVDVNHDLIAAGHPRMNFEFASYHSMYPKHWNDRAEQNYDPAREARSWAIGQLVTAEAALKLLAARAEQSAGSSSNILPIALPNPDPHSGPWPEFAEFNCYACHHDVQGGLGTPIGIPGSMPWGTWYYSATETLSRQFPPPAGDFNALLQNLRDEMTVPYPDFQAVSRKVHVTVEHLDQWIDSIESLPFDAMTVQELFKSVALNAEQRFEASRSTAKLESGEVARVEGPTWDDGAQAFLALAALYQALGDVSPSWQDPALRASLESMSEDLRFPTNSNSPSEYRSDALNNELRLISRQLGR